MSAPADGRTSADERELSELFRDRELAMRRLAYLLVGSRAVADELVQDAFEQVVRRWAVIEFPAAYLRLAVINGARSWGRRRHPLPVDSPESVDAGSGDRALDADAIAVRDALAELRDSEREAIVLRYYAGLSDREIAVQTNQPLGTVKSSIHRGLRRLRCELGSGELPGR